LDEYPSNQVSSYLYQYATMSEEAPRSLSTVQPDEEHIFHFDRTKGMTLDHGYKSISSLTCLVLFAYTGDELVCILLFRGIHRDHRCHSINT
jgi:hypothetical protein